MKIKFKKLHPKAAAPKQGTPGSAGFDLTATGRIWNETYAVWDYSTGIAVEIPPGFVGLIFPRSSVYKTGYALSNCVGVIDSDYRGEITAKFHPLFVGNDCPYNVGDRFCQLVIMPAMDIEYEEAEALSDTTRGTGGYGSTGL